MRNLALFLVLGCSYCTAATNGLDKTFGSDGVIALPATSSGIRFLRVDAIAGAANGEIIIGGRVTNPLDATETLAAIGRLGANGAWVASFGDHGVFVLPTGTSNPHGGQIDNVIVFDDGSIVAAGSTLDNATQHPRSCTLLIRLTSLGALDTGFAPDDTGAFCFDFAPQPPATSYFTHFDALSGDAQSGFYLTANDTNLNTGAVAHFDAHGSLVSGFASNGMAALPPGFYGAQLVRRPSGLLATSVDLIDTNTRTQGVAVTALDTSGNIDATYGMGGSFAFDIQSYTDTGPISNALDVQGRLLIGDNDFNGATYQSYRIARLTPSGALDSTFNGSAQHPGSPGFASPIVSGDPSYDYAVSARPLPDGRIFVVGNAGHAGSAEGTSNIALLRLNDDASYDAGFGDTSHPGWASINIGGLSSSTAFVRAASEDSSGRILVAGASDSAGQGCPMILRLIADRLFDDAFDAPAPFPNCP